MIRNKNKSDHFIILFELSSNIFLFIYYIFIKQRISIEYYQINNQKKIKLFKINFINIIITHIHV